MGGVWRAAAVELLRRVKSHQRRQLAWLPASRQGKILFALASSPTG